jgi:hypothetical protein
LLVAILVSLLAISLAFLAGERFEGWRRPRPLEAGQIRYTKNGIEYEIVNPGSAKYTAKEIAFYVTHVADGPPPKHDYKPKDVQQIMVMHQQRQADRGWVRYVRDVNSKFPAHSSKRIELILDDKTLYGGRFVCGWLVVTYTDGTKDYELQLAPIRGESMFFVWVAG